MHHWQVFFTFKFRQQGVQWRHQGWCHPVRQHFLVIALFYLPSPTFRRRFSSILYKFTHNFFHSGVTPMDGVIRGGRPPP